jgi:hypothetical protein
MVEREISQGSISSTSDGAERIGERKWKNEGEEGSGSS